MVLWGCRQRAGGALLTPFPAGNSRQLLSGPLLLFLSPSSLFSGAGPRLSSRAKGVDTGTPSPRSDPDPGRRQTLPPPVPWPCPGIYFGSMVKEPHQGAQAGASGPGNTGKGVKRQRAGAGGRCLEAQGAPSPGEPLLVSLAGGSRQVHSSGCAPTGVCPHRCAPACGPQQV